MFKETLPHLRLQISIKQDRQHLLQITPINLPSGSQDHFLATAAGVIQVETFQGRKVPLPAAVSSLEVQHGLLGNILSDLQVVQGDLVPGLPNLVGEHRLQTIRLHLRQ